MNLPSPTNDERSPYRDLSGQVAKLGENYFAYGGFSDIYKGLWTGDQGVARRVAIKILRGVHTDDRVLEVTRRRLNRESRVWHFLEHKNVLKFLGICDDLGPSPALISPLCEPGDVSQYISRHPEADRSPIIFGVAEGLMYLHSKDVIHGDLNSRNVLIDDEGCPLICDFGRSKIIDHAGFTTAFAGAVRYLAPELLGPLDEDETSGAEVTPVVTKQSDVYGFSMVGVEILTGKMPFHLVKPDIKVIRSIQTGRRPRREQFELPSQYDTTWSILEDCWTQQPESRPPMALVVKRMSVR